MKNSRHANKDHRIRQNFMKTLGIGTLLLSTVATLNFGEPRVYNYYDNGILEVTNQEQTIVITRMIPNPSRLQTLYQDQANTDILAKAQQVKKQWTKYNNQTKKELYK